MSEAPDEALVSCILRYGGRCRGCADNFGICEGSALPCDPAEARRAILHVLRAKDYYDQHPEFVEEARKFL
jgi:hypothetical protein